MRLVAEKDQGQALGQGQDQEELLDQGQGHIHDHAQDHVAMRNVIHAHDQEVPVKDDHRDIHEAEVVPAHLGEDQAVIEGEAEIEAIVADPQCLIEEGMREIEMTPNLVDALEFLGSACTLKKEI